ncbi:response regulator transcription factor [Alphaproteobacteria bacterium]|nr:response regulator transcription factor [Alphaproteobacteria bacterium]
MIENPHILLIEDDSSLLELIEKLLVNHDYIVSKSSTIKDAKEKIKFYIFDLILLDVMLPDSNGLDFYMKMIHNRINTPVIFLSALSNPDDRVAGLELGADDYVGKPFDSRELLLKIRKNIKIQDNKNIIKFNNLTKFDLKKETLTYENEKINLTSNEIKILKLLIQNSNKFLNRELLNKELNLDYLSRSSDMQISRLRMKLKKYCKLTDTIRSIHGKGYKIFY